MPYVVNFPPLRNSPEIGLHSSLRVWTQKNKPRVTPGGGQLDDSLTPTRSFPASLLCSSLFPGIASPSKQTLLFGKSL